VDCPALLDDRQSYLVNRCNHAGELSSPMENYTVRTNERNAGGMGVAVVVRTPAVPETPGLQIMR